MKIKKLKLLINNNLKQIKINKLIINNCKKKIKIKLQLKNKNNYKKIKK